MRKRKFLATLSVTDRQIRRLQVSPLTASLIVGNHLSLLMPDDLGKAFRAWNFHVFHVNAAGWDTVITFVCENLGLPIPIFEALCNGGGYGGDDADRQEVPFLQSLRSWPEDVATWSAYADFLQEFPNQKIARRGEIMARCVRGYS